MNTAQWLILIEESESVVALLMPNGQMVLGKPKVWGEDKKKLLDNLQASQQECLSAVADIDSPQQAVFVFSPFWINSEGELLGSKKKLLKNICQKIKLQPLGFLVGDEVFSQFFDDFVAVYLGQDHMRVTVVKDRAVKNRQEMDNGEQFDIKDVSILLKQINSDVILPENLVFWGSYNKRVKSKLVDYDWKENGPFTKKPNLRTLEWTETFKYIGQLILKQSGANASLVADNIIEADQVEAEIEFNDTQTVKQQSSKQTEPEAKEETKQNEDEEETEPTQPPEAQQSSDSDLPFGFVKRDLAGQEEDQDQVSEQQPPPETKPKVENSQETNQSQPKMNTDSAGRPLTQVSQDQAQPKMAGGQAKKKSKTLKSMLPSFSLPKLPKIKNKKIFVFIPLILVGLGLILGASWYLSKLDLEIYVTAKETTETKQVTLDPEADQLDVEQGIVPVEVVTAQVSGSQTRQTSGEKLIGEKATGEITIFNRTEERETFPAGTEIVGPGDFRFVLDNEVSVASKSADLTSGVDRWGEVTAQVTAADIGAEYNLAGESEFTIAGYSRTEFLARNDEDFAGGTSREVQAVSEEDQSQLRNQLSKKLEEELLAKLKEEIDDSRLIEGSIQTQVTSESFSAEVDDEVDELNLELELEGQAYELNEDRLKELAESVLSEDIEDGFILPSDSIEVEFQPNEDEDREEINGEIKMTGSLYPEIDKQEVAQAVAGKSKQSAKKTIRNYPRVYRFEDQFIPGFINWAPFYPPQAANITVRIKE
jgi:hypothetical protein